MCFFPLAPLTTLPALLVVGILAHAAVSMAAGSVVAALSAALTPVVHVSHASNEVEAP